MANVFDQFDSPVSQGNVFDQFDADPTAGMSNFDKIAAGAGKAIYDLGRGAGQILGLESQKDIDEAKRLDRPLMNTTAGKVGNVAGNIGATIPAMLIPGANTAAGAALVSGAMGALQPTSQGESRIANTAISGALGAAGQYAGNKLAGYVTRKIAERQAAQVTNAIRDATLQAGRDAGYVVPPTQSNPSIANKALEGLAGKITTAQRASQKNQAVTDSLVRNALGLAPDVPITKDTLSTIRQNAGQVYDNIKNVGTIQSDSAYTNALDAIASRFEGAAKDFPALAKPEVTDMVTSLKVPQFGADSAIDATRILRDSADTAYHTGDKALGKAYKSASDAMESLIERNLAKSGQSDLLQQFRDARQLIAKTYSIENALNESTGKVSAAKLGAQFAKGKPLSGELKLVGQFAQAFPKASQDVQRMGSLPGVSPLDYGAALISGSGAGLRGAVGTLLGRPFVRGAILSKPYQGLLATPNYGTGLLSAAKGTLKHVPYGSVAPSIYWSQQ